MNSPETGRLPMNACSRGAAIGSSIALILGLGAASAPLSVSAQGWTPTKPMRMVLRAPPGGADDIQARLLAQQLTPILGQQVLIDYRPGAGGLVAWEYVSKLPPDGHTIMLTASGLTSVRSLRPSVTIDPFRDFVWISQVSTFMLIFTGHPSLPVKSLKDVIALARKRPGELTYGSTGVGATPHMAMEYFKSTAKLDIPHVPYRGAGPMFLDLVGGRLELGTSTTASAVPHVKGGRIRGLGVTGPRRLDDLPEVPTVAEGAGLSGFEFTGFYAMIGPAGTPAEVVNSLSAAIAKAIAAPGFKEKFRAAAAGMEPIATTPEEMLAIAKRDGEKTDKIIRAANIKAD
jgi:tripartite-type tricarboxylate transporter receptor subunit TctC